jgi:hypothetical protein
MMTSILVSQWLGKKRSLLRTRTNCGATSCVSYSVSGYLTTIGVGWPSFGLGLFGINSKTACTFPQNFACTKLEQTPKIANVLLKFGICFNKIKFEIVAQNFEYLL